MGRSMIHFGLYSSTATLGFSLFVLSENVTIKWDVINWTSDGYVSTTTKRSEQSKHPGGNWGGNGQGMRSYVQIIEGAQTTEPGLNCSHSKQKQDIPFPASCSRTPKVVDLKPNHPSSQQIPHCCKGGVTSSWLIDGDNSTSAFQLTIHHAAGTTKRTIRLPRNCTFEAPGAWYTCGPAHIVKNSIFISQDKRRITQAHVTWNATCLYSGARAGAPAPAPSPTDNDSVLRNLASCGLGPGFLFPLSLFLVSLIRY